MADGREERFTALCEGTRARIIAYAMRRSASREEAADLVAETFAIAWRRFDDVPSGEAALLWLYVTARQLHANRTRQLRRRDEVVARLAHELGDVAFHEDPRDEAGLGALFCLNSLPEEQREVLMLAGWEGLGAAEIGRVLGCSPTAARIRLHRARTRLKAETSQFSAIAKQPDPTRHAPVEGTVIHCAPEEA